MRQLRHPRVEDILLTDELAALSDPVRLLIFSRLAETSGERAWSDFDVVVGASTLSHHIQVLRLAGVINHRKEGTRCFISLRPDLERSVSRVAPLYPWIHSAGNSRLV